MNRFFAHDMKLMVATAIAAMVAGCGLRSAQEKARSQPSETSPQQGDELGFTGKGGKIRPSTGNSNANPNANPNAQPGVGSVVKNGGASAISPSVGALLNDSGPAQRKPEYKLDPENVLDEETSIQGEGTQEFTQEELAAAQAELDQDYLRKLFGGDPRLMAAADVNRTTDVNGRPHAPMVTVDLQKLRIPTEVYGHWLLLPELRNSYVSNIREGLGRNLEVTMINATTGASFTVLMDTRFSRTKVNPDGTTATSWKQQDTNFFTGFADVVLGHQVPELGAIVVHGPNQRAGGLLTLSGSASGAVVYSCNQGNNCGPSDATIVGAAKANPNTWMYGIDPNNRVIMMAHENGTLSAGKRPAPGQLFVPLKDQFAKIMYDSVEGRFVLDPLTDAEFEQQTGIPVYSGGAKEVKHRNP